MENSRNRNIVLWIILSFVTCGIAALVWMVKLNNDYRELAGEEPQNGFVFVLLCLITCGIYGFIWAYQQGKRLQVINGTDNSVLYLILYIIGLSIIAIPLMQNELNKLEA